MEKATAADLPALIRLAGGDSAMVRMLAAHWADLDPSHMFNVLYADALLPEGSPGALPNRADLREVLFEQWTKRDLAGAIEALTNVPNFPGLDTLRTPVAASISPSSNNG